MMPFRHPLLAHIHLPKCAGTSFNRLLERGFQHRFLRLYVDDTNYIYSPENLTRHISDPAVAAIASHFIRHFPSSLGGRDLLYITFLRDPVQQFLSYITYCRKHYAAIASLDTNLTACLPPKMEKLSLRAAAHWILTHHKKVNFRENYVTNYFAELPYYGGVTDGPLSNRYKRKRFSIAQKVLRTFFFVGISEQMDRSVQLLRTLAQKRGIEFPNGIVGIENTSREAQDDLHWLHPDDQVGTLLLNSVREDQELYRWAYRQFETLEAQVKKNNLDHG